jgi:hypothetical protein
VLSTDRYGTTWIDVGRKPAGAITQNSPLPPSR